MIIILPSRSCLTRCHNSEMVLLVALMCECPKFMPFDTLLIPHTQKDDDIATAAAAAAVTADDNDDNVKSKMPSFIQCSMFTAHSHNSNNYNIPTNIIIKMITIA